LEDVLQYVKVTYIDGSQVRLVSEPLKHPVVTGHPAGSLIGWHLSNVFTAKYQLQLMLVVIRMPLFILHTRIHLSFLLLQIEILF